MAPQMTSFFQTEQVIGKDTGKGLQLFIEQIPGNKTDQTKAPALLSFSNQESDRQNWIKLFK